MAAQDEPQPWHAADEWPARRRRGGPIGTHSLTGGGIEVGVPEAREHTAEPGDPLERAPDGPTAEPDPLAEPRANSGDLLGRKD